MAEKCISTVGVPASPGEALRLVFEVVASGLLLPSGPGLLDPCEKETVDCLAELTAQARDDITAYAQVNNDILAQYNFRKSPGIYELNHDQIAVGDY